MSLLRSDRLNANSAHLTPIAANLHDVAVFAAEFIFAFQILP